MTFNAPVRDLAFALTELAGVERLTANGAYPDFDLDVMNAVLEGAAAVANDLLAPLNKSGDKAGARFENGKVYAAPGFADAYRQFAQGGWTGLAAEPEHGGQGLPKALELAVFEMVHAANMAFGLCPLLTQGAIEALSAHGTAEQKSLYLPKLVSGEWTGTMNLTEPQAGSDLSLVRATAEPDGEGAYRINGQKIFITWGDHDAADNIIHLVLARLPGAPEGVKGISLFIAPKYLPDADGKPGVANSLRPGGIEHKLGIHASPTCVMLFEGAKGWLVGQENNGLAHMFTMMNAARLSVGVQGVAIAERAYQQALAYAVDRRQGRAVYGVEAPSAIFDHPDIRRSLMLMKARIEAARAICLTTGVCADLAHSAADPAEREAARLRQELLVPIAKAWSTDIGVAVASEGVQIHGGMGFVEETGAAQHYRDARIAPIYEGTNSIQAIDLMGRKLGLAGGEAVRAILADIRVTAEAMKAHSDEWLHLPARRLAEGADAAERASAWLIERKGHAQPDALAGASAYLKLMGDVIGGWMLCRGAVIASGKLSTGEGDRDYWRMRLGLARVYGEAVLATAAGQEAAVTMGALDLANLTAEALSA
jgi:alkylation response protein AidB-like acyl-CoA dehydrogenase